MRPQRRGEARLERQACGVSGSPGCCAWARPAAEAVRCVGQCPAEGREALGRLVEHRQRIHGFLLTMLSPHDAVHRVWIAEPMVPLVCGMCLSFLLVSRAAETNMSQALLQYYDIFSIMKVWKREMP